MPIRRHNACWKLGRGRAYRPRSGSGFLYARCCGIPVCFPRKIGRHVHVHVHVNLPSRQDAQPQVPWRHNVGGAEKLVGIFMIPNLPGLQLPASSKRHHVHVHGKLPSHVAISAKRTTTGPVGDTTWKVKVHVEGGKAQTLCVMPAFIYSVLRSRNR